MSRKLRKEASRWLVRLQSDEVSSQDRAAFEVWYRSDTRHAAAFDALTDTIARLRQLRGRITEEPEPRASTLVLSRRGVFATAAGGALAASFFGVAWFLAASMGGESLSFETALGAQRQVDLSDGSQIELNTNTRLDVRMTAERRRVKLAHGEALFKVAHEARRPFEVEARGQVLRAVGTVFSVRVDDRASVLLVMEGAVSVTPKGGGRRQLVKATERFDLAKGFLTTALSPTEVDRALAWRRGMLDFDGVSLDAVAAEVERYTGAHFAFADPSLEDLSMAAYFRAADLKGFISLLETSYPLLRVRAIDNGYLIERRPEGTR